MATLLHRCPQESEELRTDPEYRLPWTRSDWLNDIPCKLQLTWENDVPIVHPIKQIFKARAQSLQPRECRCGDVLSVNNIPASHSPIVGTVAYKAT